MCIFFFFKPRKLQQRWQKERWAVAFVTVSEVKVTQSCPTLCDPMDLYSPWSSPGQNTGVGSLSLLQGIFPTEGSNPSLLFCRWILYGVSHRGVLMTVT